MGSALDSASLIMYPSGYSDGVLGSAKPTDGSGDFTFTRGSNLSATRVGPNGYIEKGYENLLLQSDWDDVGTQTPPTGWSSFSPSYNYEAGAETGQIRFNTSSSRGYIQQSQPYTSGVFTFSVYCDSVTITESLNSIFYPIGSTIINYQQNGVVVPANTQLSAGNRYSVTFSLTGYSFTTRIGSGCFTNVTADFTLSRPMLNQGLVAYPYIETTTAPVAGGILEDEPRIDFSDGCGHLLLEPSRTNALPNSEYLQGGNGLSILNITIDHNNATSPEGLQNAMKAKVNNGVFNTRVFINVGGSGSQVVSVFAKAGEKNAISVAGYTGTKYLYAAYNLTNGTLMGSDADNHGIEDYGNGWYRVWVYVASSTNRYAHISIGDSTDAPSFAFYTTGNGSDGLYLYGWQAEQDATYPTSYIPTYGVSQTRLAEDVYITSASSIINSEEGVLFCEVEALNEILESFFELRISNGLNQVRIQFPSGSNIQGAVYNGAYQALINYAATRKQNNKIAFKYKTNDFALFINGVKVGSDTSGTTFSANFLNRIDLGNEVKVKQALLFPTALSDSECIALTTI